MLLLTIAVVPAGAVALSSLQSPRYAASAEVLLSRQNLANSLNNVVDPALTIDPERLVDTQTNVAESPQIAAATLAAAHGVEPRTPQQFLDASSATAKTGTDVLVFRVTDRHAAAAQQLATLYAKQYASHGPEIEYLEDGVNGVVVPPGEGPDAFAARAVEAMTSESLRRRLLRGCREAARLHARRDGGTVCHGRPRSAGGAMRVLLAHNRYRVPGGEERHVELLAQGLTQAGVDVCRFERQSVRLESSRAARLAAALGLAYRPGGGGIARAIDAFRPDVVHFHNLWPLLTPAALRIAKRRGATVVLTLHNYRFACPGGTLLAGGAVHDDCVTGSSLACALRNPRGSLAESIAYGLALEVQRRLRLLNRWVDLFVAPSAFLREQMVRAGLPADRTAVVRHGVTVEPQEAVNGAEPSGLLYSGRLSPEKGIDVLLEAAGRAPDVPVAVAGVGPALERLRAVAPPSVSFLGWLDQRELAAIRARSLMTLQPSICFDVSPFAAIEAAAGGRGVIASRIGGLPEIVRDGVSGMLVEPGDPDELAQAMRAVAADPDRAMQFGRRARQLARDEFELGRQTARLIELYEAVA